MLYLAKRFDQAIKQSEQTLEMDPNYEPAYVIVGQVYSVAGSYKQAVLSLKKGLATHRSTWVLSLLGYAHARSGERTAALETLAELERTSKSEFVPASCFALVYTGLRELDQAFAFIDRACEERHNRLAYIKVEALWDPLRSDPRFADLLRRFNIPA